MSSDDINASIQKLNEELKIFRERWPGIKSQIANALNEFARAKPQLTQIAEDFSRIPAIFGNLRNLFRSFWESWMHAEYVETGNPLFVWDVYRSHRSRGENPPEWILEYFDR